MQLIRTSLLAAFACATLCVNRASAQKPGKNALLLGRVLSDSIEAPLAGAELAIPALKISVRTDSLGRYRLSGIKPGRHVVTVSQIGFEQLRTSILFATSDSVDADILMTPLALGAAQAVAKVDVVANAVPRGLSDFERRRQNGAGDFITEETIRKNARGQLADVVRRIPGVQLTRPPSGFGAYLSAGRGSSRTRVCYAAVMIDRSWVYEGRRNELPFDLNSISPDAVQAMEYYRGMSYIPAEFARERNTCGVLVIWTKQGF